MYPVTIFGRLVGVFTAIWGTFIISLLIIVASEIFELSIIEQKALHHLLQTRKAAQTITNSMKYFISKQRYLENFKDKKDDDGDGNDVENETKNSVLSNNDRDRGNFNTQPMEPIGTNFFENDEVLVNFDDGVELTEVTKNYRDMISSLKDFKEQKQTLKNLNIGDDTEQINI